MNFIPWRNRQRRAGGRARGLPSLGSMRRGMDEIFNRFFDNPTPDLDVPMGLDWNPSLDVADGDREVTVRAEIPGVDPAEIEVTVAGGLLTIAGEKKAEHEEKKKGFYRTERYFGYFRRSIPLPEGADAEKVTAEYSNGVLTVRIAKTEAAKTKKISVRRSQG